MPGAQMPDEIGPPARPLRREPLVEREAGRPRAEQRPAHARPLEDVALGVVRAARQPVGEQHGEERHEDRAEQVEEGQVVAEVDHDRAGGGGRRDERDQQPLRGWREQVLQRDRRRVDVGEGLVALVDGQHQQRDHGERAAGRDHGRDLRRLAQVAREHEQRADPEAPDRRQQVADAGAEEGAAPVAREARVVGGERRPGDDVGDHEVDPLADRDPAGAVLVPERVQVRPCRAPTRSGRRSRPRPPRRRTSSGSGGRSRSGPSARARARSRRRAAPRASARGSRRRARRAPRPRSR